MNSSFLISPFDVSFESLNEMAQLALVNSLKLQRIMKKPVKTNKHHVFKDENKENNFKPEIKNDQEKTKTDYENENILSRQVQNLSITEIIDTEQDNKSKMYFNKYTI